MKLRIQERYFGKVAALIAFALAYGFFQFGYQYHLMRREQMNLFLYDWEYIRETYRGMGWLSHFLGDFVEQFLYFPVLGPVLIALIILGIAAIPYLISRRWLGRWASLGIAFVFYVWAFMRETGNLYITQYSIAVLSYLALVFVAFLFKKRWQQAAAAALLLGAGVYAIGNPYHKYYGELWGTPEFTNEKVIALDVQASRENWDKVLKIAKKRILVNEAVYLTNLALAMKGQLGNELFDYPQNYANGLFLWVDGESSQFSVGLAGEVWYHMGNMTLAEQSAIVALQQSAKHTGTKYVKRLAEITLITEEYGAAMKYLNMLNRTLVYRKWARSMVPENQGPEEKKWLADRRADLPKEDMIYDSNFYFRDVMLQLLEANPDNMTARQYLLVYDLLNLRLEDFFNNYSAKLIKGSVYEQAALIWLTVQNRTGEEELMKYGISRQTMQRIEQFYRFPDKYKNTYWYYYLYTTAD